MGFSPKLKGKAKCYDYSKKVVQQFKNKKNEQ